MLPGCRQQGSWVRGHLCCWFGSGAQGSFSSVGCVLGNLAVVSGSHFSVFSLANTFCPVFWGVGRASGSTGWLSCGPCTLSEASPAYIHLLPPAVPLPHLAWARQPKVSSGLALTSDPSAFCPVLLLGDLFFQSYEILH